MNRLAWSLLLILALLAPRSVAAGDACACRFEVSAASGAIRPVGRATQTAAARACTFDVRLRVAAQEGGACDGASAALKGLGSPVTVDPWAMPWERVTIRAGKQGMRRRVLRARVQGSGGAVGRARIALRCDAEPLLDGCDAILAESTYCFVGGGSRPRAIGLTSDTLCGEEGQPPVTVLMTRSLAVWQGEAWTCGGGSPLGGFVATPLEGGEDRRVAGPCAATGTDGEALLVLPRAGFDAPLATNVGRARGQLPLGIGMLPPPHGNEIRAYDLPDDVPGGAYRTVFDLDAIPEGSPCGAIFFDTITGQDGIIYAAGCRQTIFGTCTPEPFVCVFDTNTGAVRPTLELDGFDGRILGLSAQPGGRLFVLTDDPTQLPPIGYVDGSGGGATITVGTNQIHAFDVSDGSRLDSTTIPTMGAQGLACVSH
ncbi:MAG TPA: hypothetical protein VGR62_10765 [Candidatus Binatia bacterium]|jgi:hypothetical protein|nr:hypothetical protein [Candidatus Binatia bacterium]